uniref:Uncharacterized protein n=1 Tax=Anguilla anguilla TaxID=7936 RepID=A0A0E9PMN5_ANGAN
MMILNLTPTTGRYFIFNFSTVPKLIYCGKTIAVTHTRGRCFNPYCFLKQTFLLFVLRALGDLSRSLVSKVFLTIHLLIISYCFRFRLS